MRSGHVTHVCKWDRPAESLTWQANQHSNRANLPAGGYAEYRLGTLNNDILDEVRLPLE